MFETPITVVGRLVSDPKRRTVGAQDVVKFRLASNARRRAENGNWEPGDSLFVNVNCWGRLVTGVAATLKKGDAVIAVGNLYTSEMRATAVGPDLSRYIATLRRVEELTPRDDTTEGTSVAEDGAEVAEDLDEESPLPLSA